MMDKNNEFEFERQFSGDELNILIYQMVKHEINRGFKRQIDENEFKRLVSEMLRLSKQYALDQKIDKEQLLIILRSTFISLNGPGIAPKHPPGNRRRLDRRQECRKSHGIFGYLPKW